MTKTKTKPKSKPKARPRKKKQKKGTGITAGQIMSRIVRFIRSEQGRKTGGLIIILVAVVMMVSFISHFFHGNQDQTVVAGGINGNPGGERAGNWLGSLGAWLSNIFVREGFGIMSLLIAAYTGLLGFAILENKYYRFLWRFLGISIFAVLWGACFFSYIGYFVTKGGTIVGGGFGWYLNESLFNITGVFGMGLILVVTLLIFLVAVFNMEFPVSRWLQAILPKTKEGEADASQAKQTATAETASTSATAETDEAATAEPEEEPDPEEDFILSVRKVGNEDQQPQPETETPPTARKPEDIEVPKLEVRYTEEELRRMAAEKAALDEANAILQQAATQDPNPGPATEQQPQQETAPAAKAPVEDSNGDIELSLELPKDLKDTEGTSNAAGELEFVIEEALPTEEVPVNPNFQSQDNIVKTGQDRYEKIVPEKDQESLKSEEELADWEEYDPTLELSDYQYPPLDILEARDGAKSREINRAELEENKNKIVKTLNNYKIEITSIKATIGPTVTLYEIVPAPGVRINKIRSLEDDIALSLAALGIRIIAPIPGKGTIGIEIPNSKPEIVSMRSTVGTEKFRDTKAHLPLVMGRTISNEVFIADLAKMPHLLIAGATGQGKSVGINGIISSLLYKKHPAQIKFVLIDPKKVELSLYSALEKHFLAKLEGYDEPIITDTKQVIHVLNSLCVEMDTRYELLKAAKVRNIREYNDKFTSRRLNPKKGHKYMPYIVLVIDEFADLMMTAGKEIETPIARLAQLARAIGIHLVMATQRPSVNVITGIIKANFPARISYRVTSKVDSRTILDTGGADQLIGRGDMLLSTGNELVRIQNSFIDTPEVDQLVEFIAQQRGYPQPYFLPEVPMEGDESGGSGDEDLERDAMFGEAARLVVRHQQGSTSLIQRRLKLGYNRAGRIIDQLERAGIVGPFSGSKAREVLVPDEFQLEQILTTLE